LNNYYWNCF